jgi:TP901 family phage tail tape measure protein
MADEQIVTNIVATADFSNLIADVHKVTASLSQLQQSIVSSNKMLANQIAVMNRSFSDTLRSTGQYSTHFVSLTSDVEKFGKNLDGGRMKLSQYFDTFRGHVTKSGGSIRELARQQVQLQNAILQPLGKNAQGLMQFNVHVPRGLDEIKNKTAIARQELQIMNKVMQDGANSLINWGKNTQWAGRQLTVGLTVPMAAFGAASAKAFREADQELTRLTKVYGDVAGTSAQELSRVRQEVTQTSKELSSAYGVSFKETIALAADIAATGKQGDELLGSIKETSRLAVLGEVDRQEAMQATLAIQSAFKQNTDELAKSINFLNAVENQTSTTLNDLVEAIPKAGPVIKGLGGSVQDLALYLTAMREGGVNAAEGANALKSALASLINPTDVAVKKFEGFGIDLLGIVNNNAGNVTETLLALQKSLDSLDPLQKQQAIEQLFGKFQFSRLNALFENLGKQGSQTLQVLDLMKASSSELETVAARELTAVTESASGKYRRALESVKAELAVVGESFLTVGTFMLNAIEKVLELITSLPKPIKQILTFLGGMTAVAGPLIMLTGVLANFFGYIVKGAMHFKALFKGGEGWKYLTPEIVAAEKASKQFAGTMYEDAKAASVLSMALRNLIDEFTILEGKARSGNTSVAPALTTMAGNLVSGAAAPRIVDKNHPLVGEPYTRASTHMNPRAGMTDAERMSQTLFGFVPGSSPLNRKIGDTPQIYMHERLPDFEGVTTVKGSSTGVVASEAAKFHTMMATLGMQSKEEIANLKKTIATTGALSKDFMQTFDDILPAVSSITDNAARQSAAIVAQLRAGKINVEQARAQIIALNTDIERQIGTAVTAAATGMGRTINLTQVPTLDQPVVNSVGKSNLRELFKKSKTKDFIESIARSLGVRTSGAGYNIETTKPKKFNMGGNVFFNNGDQVPGFGNTDTVPAMLTPGEFVIRKSVAEQDPDGMRALNNGEATIVPVQRRFAGGAILNTLSRIGAWNRNRVQSVRRIYGNDVNPSTRKFSEDFNYGPDPYSSMERRTSRFWNNPLLRPGARKEGEVLAHVITSKYLRRFKNFRMQGSAPVMTGSQMQSQFGSMPRGQSANKEYQLLPDNVINVPGPFNTALSSGSATGAMWLDSNRQPQHLISLMSHLLNAGVPYKVAYRVASRTLSRVDKAMLNLKDTPLSETKWGNIVDGAMDMELRNLQASYQKGAQYNFNKGGMVPGYVIGGGIRSLSKSAVARLTAKWGKVYGGDSLANTDPLHGPLQIGRYAGPMTIRSRRQGASIGYLGGYIEREWQGGPNKGQKYMSPSRSSRVPAFLTGSETERGRYVTEEYMRGNYNVLNEPGAKEAMLAVRKKASGRFFRGINLSGYSNAGGNMRPLPDWLLTEIKNAQSTGDFSKLLGKEFVMRRSSWSSNPETASGFGSFNLTADVKNRRVTPASEMFPELDFSTSTGGKVKVNESESIFGGKFRIVGADSGGLKIETVSGPRGGNRRFGGDVSAGGSYVVGENGPETFVPGSSGRIIPGYVRGGSVMDNLRMRGWLPGQASMPLNYQADGSLLPGPAPRRPMSMGMSMGVGIAGSMVGGSVGQSLGGGTGAMIGNMAGFMLPQLLSGITRSIKGAGGLVKTIMSLGKILKSLTIPGAIVTVLGLLVKKTLDYKKNLEDVGKANRLAFGGTKESFASVGINNFETVAEKIKDVNAALELHKAKVLSTFESYTAAGPTGLTLTIKELREAIEKAKTSQKDYVEAFNNIDSSRVTEYAAQMKAQFVAMGMSAQDATNQIYAIIKASEKSGQALAAITSSDFTKIQDQISGIKFLMKNLKAELSSEDFNAEEFNRGLDTLISSVMSYRENLLSVKEDGKLIYDDASSLAKVMEEINKLSSARKIMSEDQVEALKNENIIYGAILGKAETLESVTAKILLYQEGFADTIDLASMAGADAVLFAKNLSTIREGMDAMTEDTSSKNPLSGLAKIIEKVKSEADKANAVVKKLKKVDEDYYKNKIDSINKTIKALEKERQARLKALDVQEEAQTYEVQLSQAQIRYKQAVATGDLALAAQEQLSIEQMVSDRQRQLTRNSINEVYDAKIEKLQDQIESLRNQLDAINKSNAAKTATATATTAELAVLEGFRDQLERIAIRNLGKATISDSDKKEIGNIFKAMKDAGGEVAKAAEAMKSRFGVYTNPDDARRGSQRTFEQNLIDELNSSLVGNNAGNKIFTKAVDEFKLAVEKFAGSSIGSGTIKASDIKIVGGPGGAPPAITVSKETLDNAGIDFKKGTVFSDDKGNKFEITFTASKTARVKRLASGGMVQGPGSGTSDSIPAMLSDGEFVIKAAAVNKYGKEVFDSFNSLKLANGGYVASSYSMPSINTGGGSRYGAAAARFSGGGMATLDGRLSQGNNGTMGNTVLNVTNTYYIPESLTKEEVGRYIVDLQKKELSRFGVNRSI